MIPSWYLTEAEPGFESPFAPLSRRRMLADHAARGAVRFRPVQHGFVYWHFKFSAGKTEHG
jgi:hypothetical protein